MKKILFVMAVFAFLVSCSKDDDEQSSVSQYYPGLTVPESFIAEQGEDAFFTCQPVPEIIFSFMQGKTYKSDCTVPRDSLRYLLCLHRNINGESKVGEMVVNKSIAETVLNIFRQLYDANYPIERMRLPDYWDADDEMQMRDNNSSSFNFRFISHTTRVSRHGLGLAVDINTLYNPYHKILDDGTEDIEPATGAPYLDRTQSFDYKIEEGDLCWKLFTENGFDWGGSWINRKDYQHFEIPETSAN